MTNNEENKIIVSNNSNQSIRTLSLQSLIFLSPMKAPNIVTYLLSKLYLACQCVRNILCSTPKLNEKSYNLYNNIYITHYTQK